MKVKELKKFLERVDDDFEVIISGKKEIPITERGSYPYPYNFSNFTPMCGDIGYSDKTIIIDINLDN